MTSRPRCFPGLLVLIACVSLPAQAQEPDEPDSSGSRHGAVALVKVGSTTADLMRWTQLLDGEPRSGMLIRSTSTLTPPLSADPSGGFRWQAVLPELRTVLNSDLPLSLNEGALWAGRGRTVQVSGGARAAYGRFAVVVAPEVIHHQNLPFQVIPNPLDDRSQFASPWHTGPASLDLPLRFGDQAFTVVDPGQSSLTWKGEKVSVGVTSESQWWGPGIRNAIVISNNAPGIPRAFLRTATPIETRWGTFEAEWMLGRLTESAYFDTVPGNDHRSINSIALTFQPAWETGLTVGFARAVYASLGSQGALATRLFDTFRDVAPPEASSLGSSEQTTARDQIFSFFGRWILPSSGFEAYAEWARMERPRSLRDFLAVPHHSQGYTLGLQWARPLDSGTALRLHGELSHLERSSTFRNRDVTTYYASRAVPQGFTHRGRIVGAAIGPGASSQWVAADLWRETGRVGLFGARIRWEDDAFFTTQVFPFTFDHDVTVLGGIRGGYRTRRAQVDFEASTSKRFNYLFQNPSVHLHAPAGVDIRNRTLRVTITPLSKD